MPDLTIDFLLANSCSNPSEFEGYNIYNIELHCVDVKVTAKRLENGKYDIYSYTMRDT